MSNRFMSIETKITCRFTQVSLVWSERGLKAVSQERDLIPQIDLLKVLREVQENLSSIKRLFQNLKIGLNMETLCNLKSHKVEVFRDPSLV